MKLAHDIIILVADGTRMLLLKNHGNPLNPDLRVIGHRQFENPPNRDLLADAPGISVSRAFPGHDTIARGDPHQANEDAFLMEAAEALAGVVEASAGLVVVAPPRALGVLRQHYGDHVRARLLAEIDKDLVRHPVDDIARLLCAYPDTAEA
ncbi:host attachment family protein [Novosphingobium humi]|uniref:Host attachment family protein n=1 Tax=Novosphingobium humi TaxID=2282397 RepID=A0ABY7TZ83_9SPHN|nr:host attachment family protein [Novosphingobium humi]WCT78601.1 host attachment family protein [Novosphingobium humi]WJS97791.1 host attachment family protein [Novosphingobium humi]